MSARLEVEFGSDMPVAAVDVLNPDLEVIARGMLSPGHAKVFDVESDQAFLRIHLPDGRTVTLTDDRGTLKRVVNAKQVAPVTSPSKPVRRRQWPAEGSGSGAGMASSLAFEGLEDAGYIGRAERDGFAKSARGATPSVSAPGDALPLGTDGWTSLRGPIASLSGRSRNRNSGQRWSLDARATDSPLQFTYHTPGGVSVDLMLPATIRSIAVEFRKPRAGPTLLRVELASRSGAADAILGYLQRGDMYSAEAMTDFSDAAEAMVYHDDQDPYSGIIGAYLLLRLRQFGRMRTWVREIADRFQFLPDGCVVWAWQQIHEHRGKSSEPESYLFEAARRGLPVYTEGFRLLLDGLRLLGDEGRNELERIQSLASYVVWESPITTTLRVDVNQGGGRHVVPPKVEVTFGPEQQPPDLGITSAPVSLPALPGGEPVSP